MHGPSVASAVGVASTVVGDAAIDCVGCVAWTGDAASVGCPDGTVSGALVDALSTGVSDGVSRRFGSSVGATNPLAGSGVTKGVGVACEIVAIPVRSTSVGATESLAAW